MRSSKTDINDPASERLLDIMLSEALGESSPPDVSSHVLGILDADTKSVPGLPTIDTSAGDQRRRSAWLPLALAGALLLAVSGYVWERSQRIANPIADPSVPTQSDHLAKADVPTAEAHPSTGADNATHVPEAAESNEHRLAEATPDAEPNRPKRKDFEIAIEDLPFGPKPLEPADTVADKAAAKEALPSAPDIEKLSGELIVQQLNDLLQRGWKDLDVQPQPVATVDEVARRLAARTQGSGTVTQTHRQLASNLLGGNIDEALQQFASGGAAADHLGVRWARYMLGDYGWTRLSKQQQIAAGDLFTQCFSGELRYDQAVQSLLTTEGASFVEEEGFDPATLWMTGLASPRSTALTDQFCNVLLDIDASCGRCHVHPFEDNFAQQDYWSLNAVFQTGVHWKLGKNGHLQLVNEADRDRSSDVVFYESSDGRQLVAAPSVNAKWLANQQTSAATKVSSLNELATQVRNSDQLAHATINGLWKLVYGNRIVGRKSDPLSPPADSAFSEAKDLLAGQLRAHDYDLGAATSWIIAAKPMLLGAGLSSFDQQSLVASKEQLQQADRQRRAFAAYAVDEQDWSFGQLVAAAEKFNGRAGGGLLATPGGLLAQPSEANPSVKEPVKSKSDQLMDALHRSFSATKTQQSLPAAWLASLTAHGGFLQQARHLFYAAGNSQPSDKQIESAMRIRKSSDNDQAALNQLWWAIRFSNES